MYNIVSEKSKLKTLYFNTYEYDKGNKKKKNENEVVNIESLNRFEITVDDSGKRLDIEVIDANGKVVSYIKSNISVANDGPVWDVDNQNE